MLTNVSYVQWIQNNVITIFSDNTEKQVFLMSIKARRKIFNKKIWKLAYMNDEDLAELLQKLKDNSFMFEGGTHGWNPADIYKYEK